MRAMVYHTPVAQVRSLPKKEQKEWAQHVLSRSHLHSENLKWATGASRLVNRAVHPHAKHSAVAKGLRSKHSIAIEPLPSRGKAGKVLFVNTCDVRACTYTHAHACANTYTHIYILTHTHTHIHTHFLSHTHTHTQYTHTRTYTCTYMYV